MIELIEKIPIIASIFFVFLQVSVFLLELFLQSLFCIIRLIIFYLYFCPTTQKSMDTNTHNSRLFFRSFFLLTNPLFSTHFSNYISYFHIHRCKHVFCFFS